MSKKVTLGILDDDLRIRTLKKYPLSDNGKQIKVVSGGEGHFMPAFDNDSFIEIPKTFLGKQVGWQRIYLAKKLAKKCINFRTEEIFLPDIEQLKISLGATMLNKIGKPEEPFPVWVLYAILLLAIGTALKVFGVIA